MTAAAYVHKSHATLGRIERGLIPYNQALLEGLAELYRCEPGDLIMRDPTSLGPWSIWDQILPEDRKAAQGMLEGLARRNPAPVATPQPIKAPARRRAS